MVQSSRLLGHAPPRIGTVDLNDVALKNPVEFVVSPSCKAVLSVTVDGKPALPAALKVRLYGSALIEGVVEKHELGQIHYQLRPAHPASEETLSFEVPGFSYQGKDTHSFGVPRPAKTAKAILELKALPSVQLFVRFASVEPPSIDLDWWVPELSAWKPLRLPQKWRVVPGGYALTFYGVGSGRRYRMGDRATNWWSRDFWVDGNSGGRVELNLDVNPRAR